MKTNTGGDNAGKNFKIEDHLQDSLVVIKTY